MGIVVNLVDSWEPYRAARSALLNTLDSGNIRDCAQRHAQHIAKLVPHTQQLLKEGVLNEEAVLGHVTKILNVARECNVTLRWLILHTAPTLTGEFNSLFKKKKIYQV